MIKEIYFDEVFDTQTAFRSIMQALARPGQLQKLDAMKKLNPPKPLNAATACIGLTLMSQDSLFHVEEQQFPQGKEYFSVNTSARFCEISEAAFLYIQGQDSTATIAKAHTGLLEYPETSATVIIDVMAMSEEPMADALALNMQGPGVLDEKTVFIKGINPEILGMIQAKNGEYPLGIDVFMTDKKNQVLGIPRTNQFKWKSS